MAANFKSTFNEIRAKVEAHQRLSMDDGLLLSSPAVHLNELGELANLVRERKNGNAGYYNINTHLNPTNVCVYRCVFCAFRSDLRDPKGYVMSDEQILARGQEAVDTGCTEMHIVGGLHHQMKFDWYLNLIRMLHDHLSVAASERLDRRRNQLVHASHQKACAQDILEELGRRRPRQPARRRGGDFSSRSPRQNLRAQGRRPQLARHPPHGPRARPAVQRHHALWPHRKRLPPRRPSAAPARAAGRDRRLSDVHSAGVPSGEHRPVAHQKAVGLMDLRTMAVSRLMLDNFPHIKAYWIMLGIGTAQSPWPTGPTTSTAPCATS